MAEQEKALRVSLVTPQRMIFSDEPANYVYAPGALGCLGILPGHMPMVSSLGAGELRVMEKHGPEVRFEINSGFVQVKDDRVIILVEEARERS